MKQFQEINLDDWRWLRKIRGLDIEAYDHYFEMARKNEAMIVAIYGEDAFNIYLPVKRKRVPKSNVGEESK